jgi:hypothetical protein
VVYRNRTAEEIRDIGVARLVDGDWSGADEMFPDNWHSPGCPVNGPAIAADGRRIAVAWFTEGADERPQVRLAFSDDHGASFGDPLPIDGGSPIGRVDVVLLEDGSALVSWIERGESSASLAVRRAFPDGRLEPPIVAASTSVSRSSGFPRMVRHDGEIVMAWTQTGEPSSVRSGTLLLPTEPATD